MQVYLKASKIVSHIKVFFMIKKLTSALEQIKAIPDTKRRTYKEWESGHCTQYGVYFSFNVKEEGSRDISL